MSPRWALLKNPPREASLAIKACVKVPYSAATDDHMFGDCDDGCSPMIAVNRVNGSGDNSMLPASIQSNHDGFMHVKMCFTKPSCRTISLIIFVSARSFLGAALAW